MTLRPVLTLSEGSVGGTPSFSETDRGAVVRLSMLGGQGSHGWVGGPCAQERRRSDGGGRAVGRCHFTEREWILWQADVTVHRAHIVTHVRVHAPHGGVVAQSE